MYTPRWVGVSSIVYLCMYPWVGVSSIVYLCMYPWVGVSSIVYLCMYPWVGVSSIVYLCMYPWVGVSSIMYGIYCTIRTSLHQQHSVGHPSTPLLCLIANGNCEHDCSQVGNFPNYTVSCSCHHGYQLDDNEKTCSGEYL